MIQPLPRLVIPTLGSAAFAARVPAAYRDPSGLILLRDRLERDFALTRLVAANCAWCPANPDTPSNFVLKGGYALRHLYGSVRYSKDADFAMSSGDLVIQGHPDDLSLPPGMAIATAPLAPGNETYKIRIKYKTSEGRNDFIQCDLNSVERPVQLFPPQHRPHKSAFADEFEVWAAHLEEIVGEKFFALIDMGAERIKDIYDTHHVLRDRSLKIGPDKTKAVYDFHRNRKRRGPEFDSLIPAFMDIRERGEGQWEQDLGDLSPRPDLVATSDALFDLMVERLRIKPAP